MRPYSRHVKARATEAMPLVERPSKRFTAPGTVGFIPHRCKGGRLIVIFGECQLMAEVITKESPVSQLIRKDFRVCHPPLARRNYAVVTLNHQK